MTELKIVNSREFEEELAYAVKNAQNNPGDRFFAVAEFNKSVVNDVDLAEGMMQEYIPEAVMDSTNVIIELSDQLDLKDNELEYRVIKKED